MAAFSSQAVRVELSTGQVDGGGWVGVEDILYIAVVRLCWILVMCS